MNESENRGPVRPGNQKPFDLPVGLMAAVGVHALLFVENRTRVVLRRTLGA